MILIDVDSYDLFNSIINNYIKINNLQRNKDYSKLYIKNDQYLKYEFIDKSHENLIKLSLL